MVTSSNFDFEKNNYLPILTDEKLEFSPFLDIDQPQEVYLNQFLNENESSLELRDLLTLQEFCSHLEKHYQKRVQKLSHEEPLVSKIYQTALQENQLHSLKVRIELATNKLLSEIQERKKQLEESSIAAVLNERLIQEIAKSCEQLLRRIKPKPEAHIGYEYPCKIHTESSFFFLFQDTIEKNFYLINKSLLFNKVTSKIAPSTFLQHFSICIPNNCNHSIKALEEKDLRIARIRIRYRQLLSIPEKFKEVTTNHLLYTAEAIENNLSLPMPNQHLRSNQKENRPYSLQFEDESKRVFVNCKRKIHEVKSGSSKKVTISFLVPYSLGEKAIAVAQKVFNKNDAINSEIEVQTLLQQSSPIILGHYFYNKPLTAVFTKPTNIAKVSIYERYFDNDLATTPSERLTWNEKISAIIHLTQELLSIHKQSYLHGDIKLLNMLFRRDTSLGTTECRITDFGFSFSLKERIPNFVLQRGYYGSIVPTAPEVLGSTWGTYDPIMAETFAFAIALWRWINKGEIPWAKFLNNLYKSGLPVSNINKEIFTINVGLFLENEESKLKQQDPNSIHVQLNNIFIKMLHPAPSKRLHLKDALVQFNTLCFPPNLPLNM